MILERLKDATRAAHLRLEARVALESRLRDRGAYRRLLEQFYGFYVPLERSLGRAEWAPLGFDFDARRGVPALARDLLALGADAAALGDLPCCVALPDLTHRPAALGALYVHQGATLGGSVVARRAADALGVGPADGAAFFHGAGAETGDRWREVRSLLERCTATAADADDVVRSAHATFQAFDDWLAACRAARGLR
jgi:heme oxygenase